MNAELNKLTFNDEGCTSLWNMLDVVWLEDSCCVYPESPSFHVFALFHLSNVAFLIIIVFVVHHHNHWITINPTIVNRSLCTRTERLAKIQRGNATFLKIS